MKPLILQFKQGTTTAARKKHQGAVTMAQTIYCQAGLSLIELMIALLLSAAMITALLQTLNTTYKNRSMLTAKNQIHFNGHHALNTLMHHLRYNSYEGCKPPGMHTISSALGESVQSTTSTLAGGPNVFFPITDPTAQSLLGFDTDTNGNLQPAPPNTQISAAIAALNPQPRTESSIILSYNVSQDMMLSSNTMTANTDSISISSNALNLVENDYAFITDCFNATVFQVRNAPNAAIQHDGLPTIYNTNAEIRRVEFNIFYIGDTNRRDLSGEPIYALYLNQNGQSQELAEGVMLMKAAYHMPQANQHQYLPPSAPGLDMQKVRMLQVALLTASVSQALNAADNSNYQLLSETYGPNDLNGELRSRQLKHVFTGSVKLRNRG